MVAGIVIDSACLIQQESACTSRKGACLYYDPVNFRYRMHGFVVAIKVVACLFYLLALWFSRKAQYADEAENEQKESEMLSRKDEADAHMEATEKLSGV